MIHVTDPYPITPTPKNGAMGEMVTNEKAAYHHYFDLFDQAPFAYLVIDANGSIRAANGAAANALNAPKIALAGKPFINFIHQDDQDHYFRRLDACRAASHSICFESRIEPLDGDCFDTSLHMWSGKNTSTGAVEYRTAFISVRHKAILSRHALQIECIRLNRDCQEIETLLTAYAQRIKAFLQCSSVGIRITDASDQGPVIVDEGFPPAFFSKETDPEFEVDQHLQQTISAVTLTHAGANCSPNGSLYLNTASAFLDEVSSCEFAWLRDITVAHGYESVVVIPIEFDGVRIGWLCAADRRRQRFPLRIVQSLEAVASQLAGDLDRLRLQENLHASVSSLKDLSSHLLTVQEDEQQRIAMELHDGCGQDLNVLKLRLLGIQKRLPAEATELREECKLLLSHTDKIINDIRAIAHDLKPAALDALGLVVATGQMIREFSSLSGIQVEAKINALQGVTDPIAQLCLFRIFQEALSNIQKHAQATWVLISASCAGRKLRITIRDNGKGFKTAPPSDQVTQTKGLGLSTMALRCRMIGGQLDIQSTLQRGTQLTVWLPYGNNWERNR